MKNSLLIKTVPAFFLVHLMTVCFLTSFSLVFADDILLDLPLNSGSPRGGAEFGFSIDIDGNYAVASAHKDDVQVGGTMYYEAGKVWTLEKTNGLWLIDSELTRNETPAQNDLFGESVAINGNFIVVGAPLVNLPTKEDAGAIYVFERDGSSWGPPVKLIADDASSYDQFGHSVDIHGDYIIVGAPHNDAAYIFKLENGNWVQKQKLFVSTPDTFGNSVSITDGFAIVGDQHDNDENGDYSGIAYIFINNNDTWTEEEQLFPDDAQQYDMFGASVSIDGEYVIVGAPLVDFTVTNPVKLQGSAYIFKRTNGVWIQQHTGPLRAGDTTPGGNHFGTSVSINGHSAVVGATGDNENGEDSGAAFLFRRTGPAWVNQTRLLAIDGGMNDHLGRSVAVDSGNILMGAPRYQYGSNLGGVYVHVFPSSDFDNDGDVDGLDLYSFMTDLISGDAQMDYLPIFAQSFGYDSSMGGSPEMMMQGGSYSFTSESVSLTISSESQTTSEDVSDLFLIRAC